MKHLIEQLESLTEEWGRRPPPTEALVYNLDRFGLRGFKIGSSTRGIMRFSFKTDFDWEDYEPALDELEKIFKKAGFKIYSRIPSDGRRLLPDEIVMYLAYRDGRVTVSVKKYAGNKIMVEGETGFARGSSRYNSVIGNK